MEKQKEQILPDWFDGLIYEEGSIVENPFSGCSCYLNNKELSMYDFIKGCEFLLEQNIGTLEIKNLFYQSLYWFQENNAIAYLTLLD
jgi:hypothetical protein